MVFTAIAEDTQDPYHDGPCVGAAMGVAGDDGSLAPSRAARRLYKIEGVATRVDSNVHPPTSGHGCRRSDDSCQFVHGDTAEFRILAIQFCHEPIGTPHAQNGRDGVIAPTRSTTTQPPTLKKRFGSALGSSILE